MAPYAVSSITAISDDTGKPGDFITSDDTLIIKGGLSQGLQADEMLQIRIDGGDWQQVTDISPAARGWIWNYDNTANALPLGKHVVETRTIDAAGNITAGGTKDIEIVPAGSAPPPPPSSSSGTSLHIKLAFEPNIMPRDVEGTLFLRNSTGKVVAQRENVPWHQVRGRGFGEEAAIYQFDNLNPSESYSLSAVFGGTYFGAIPAGEVANLLPSWQTIHQEHIYPTWGGLQSNSGQQIHVLSDYNFSSRDDVLLIGSTDSHIIHVSLDPAFGGTWRYYTGGQGIDMIDLKQATENLSIHLNKSGQTSSWISHFGNGVDAILEDINGVYGGSGDDYFYGNADDNYFEGRGGDDRFELVSGTNNTLIYRTLDDADATGGNGHDSVWGLTSIDGLTLDLRGLLIDYDPSKDIHDYLFVNTNGSDTWLEVDRDGRGNSFHIVGLLYFDGVSFDLDTLWQNGQILV